MTFTTDAYADITMFGDVALAMLEMMGRTRCYFGIRCPYGAESIKSGPGCRKAPAIY